MIALAKLGLCVALFVNCINCARILGVFPLPWGSHYILGTKLLRGLAEAGHDITMITPYRYKETPTNGSWTDILLDGAEGKLPVPNQNELFQVGQKNFIEQYYMYLNWLTATSNITLNHPNVQALINSNATFDAVIVGNMMAEAQFILAHIFECPLILLSTVGPNGATNEKAGNPSPASTIPNFFMQFEDKHMMTLKERFWNTIYYIVGHYYMHSEQIPRNGRILQETFPDLPNIYDIYYNVSLILLNSHLSYTGAVPLAPNMIEIGGYYIDPPKKLPKDLQDFLDDAKDGAIYFSMGSHLKSDIMPEEKKKIFLNVFKKLKQKVLWKLEVDLPEKSKNVFIGKWMPQQEILAHPNVKLFITHGGLLSTSEAIYNGVPLLIMPLFGDQKTNAAQAVKNGYGLRLSFHTLTETDLSNAVQELLYNKTYTEAIRKTSELFLDRPMSPLETAIYWVEYVIRHKGAPHLKVPGVGIDWYKYYNLDIYAIVLVVVSLFLYGLSFLIKSVIRFIRGSRKIKIS
ncbi:unnamed protein product [Ceutorhynchus assimilis]|uniref:UDP-glucuronosyltransferase n=1 Tax=Ceutorhynchus assimilis TaxID=467358 RepID=A0A9N9QER8_9CUCU|nr:unnamed protein product [Ceutorhynchus assimilis]